jgi:hypothetical protein
LETLDVMRGVDDNTGGEGVSAGLSDAALDLFDIDALATYFMSRSEAEREADMTFMRAFFLPSGDRVTHERLLYAIKRHHY